MEFMTIVALVGVGLVAFVLGWFFAGGNKQLKDLKREKEELVVAHDAQLLDLAEQQQAMFEPLTVANDCNTNDVVHKVNAAVLNTGQTVDTVTGELQRASDLVAGMYSTLPTIQQSGEQVLATSRQSKAKLDELANMSESWQTSMQILQQTQACISDISEKSMEIRDVSSEANLLALNASIEAARAGDHGRGFAVVAEQMRALSLKSERDTEAIAASVSLAMSQVESIIQGINDNINKLVSAIDESTLLFANLEQEAESIGSTISESMGSATAVESEFKSIHANINSQLEDVNNTLNNMMRDVA